jgi:sterol 3beta-glucosyltransferase
MVDGLVVSSTNSSPFVIITPTMSTQSSSGEDEVRNASPTLPRLFNDASLYQAVLSDHEPKRPENTKHNHEVVNGFADLIARDLNSDSPENAITGRLANLTVTGDSWPDAGLFAEPESYGSEGDNDELSSQDDYKKDGERPLAPSPSRSLSADSSIPAPDEIIDLLIEEFGPLAADGEEEKLIIEADGAWLHDVVVLVYVSAFRILCC